MTEQDLKYLLSAYQARSQEMFAQLVAVEAKNMQLNQLVESLNKTIKQLESSKQKRGSKTTEIISNV